MQNRVKHTFFSKKHFILTTLGLFVVLCIVIAGTVYRTKTQMQELFKLNKELQEQNYYMADFEFKALGIAYLLDKGHYYASLTLLNRLHTQLTTKAHLVKIPEFSSKEDELEFYLRLQNPKTGAFIDDIYPSNTFHGPTENVLLHLEALAKDIGQPLCLKYPLTYLDDINTPEKLIAFLDDVSTVGWLGSKLPQTSFVIARELLSLAKTPEDYHEDDVSVVQKYQLYHFSPEWERAMLQWFWDNQDPTTGLWGPKSKNGTLLVKDFNNTASIIKAFVDRQRHAIHESFPLRYPDELIKSVLEAISEPVPADDEFAALHEWNMETQKSISLLTRYLWNEASQQQKDNAKVLIEEYIRIKCKKYYIPEEGSFSYYPGGKHATLDGASGFFMFQDIGAFSSNTQQTLWGTPKETIRDFGSIDISNVTHHDFDVLIHAEKVNSLRFYQATPDETNWTADVFAIVYPRNTTVLDIMDYAQHIKHWLETTPQTMGNWVSKAELRHRLGSLHIEEAPVYEERIPLEQANDVLQKNRRLVAIGFDVLQVPRYKIVYEYSAE